MTDFTDKSPYPCPGCGRPIPYFAVICTACSAMPALLYEPVTVKHMGPEWVARYEAECDFERHRARFQRSGGA